MDDFGVLVKNYGIKPQGKSAPMAASKTAPRTTTTTTTTHNYKSVNLDPSFGTHTHNSNSGTGSFFNDHNDDIFGFNSVKCSNNYSSSDVFDDVFQMPMKNPSFSSGGGGGVDFDIESMLKGSMNLNSNSNSKPPSNVDDDLIWGFSGNGSTNVVVETDDLLSSDPVDDFLGKLGNLGSDQRVSKGTKSVELKRNKFIADDLIPGFGTSSASNDRAQASAAEKSSGSSSLEELEEFAMGRTNVSSVKKEEKKTANQKSRETNFIDIDGSFNGYSEPMFPEEAPDLDSFFGAHTKKSVPVAEDTSMNGKSTEVSDLFSESAFGMEKKVSSRDFPDDFSSIFGAVPTSGVFEEIEGESDERRRLRLERHQKAMGRMEQALAQLNQREYEAQQEQEERYRIAEAMDLEMKQWAAGKEGNLRALLSSLQQVLPPALGWRQVTLTDLITSSQVKVVYKKAALCVHPDKVQQKGASLQQKYVAEKVFDLLKEAWNKFNTEELR
ncbi:hypothetical protein BVRB_1g010040 [Beta vulgaris subsp. vulgaris]|uniref:auxilin-related protein 1 n=1 Tax=Beta vulgaris subsp. vulgaris TaxID=3555 RepID=UPI00053F5255|nr:auxilin-related protein 1 [Beta vulgaris subsp. vulgaris]KMT19960.1 hypothetical protein BVRB_1g010040 [Beta vulgaris subsp. vulgaris]